MQNDFLITSQFTWALFNMAQRKFQFTNAKIKHVYIQLKALQMGPTQGQVPHCIVGPEVKINSCPLYFASSRVTVSVPDSAQKHNIWGIFWIENLS